MVDDIPSLFKGEHLFVNKNSQQFDCADGWVSIVELDFVFLSKHLEPIVMSFFVSANDVVQTCRAEKVLLLESQFFSGVCLVVRVKN